MFTRYLYNQIRRALRSGFSHREISRIFDVSRRSVSEIASGKYKLSRRAKLGKPVKDLKKCDPWKCEECGMMLDVPPPCLHCKINREAERKL